MAHTTEYCENCGKVIGALEKAYVHQNTIVCVVCNNRLRGVTSVPSQAPAGKEVHKMSRKKLLGIIGTIVLFIGVFMPLISPDFPYEVVQKK